MRTILVVLLLCAGSPAAWAKMLTIPKGAIQVHQLHAELLSAFSAWRGTPQADGTLVDPLLQVESTEQEIRLTVADTTPEAAVQAVVAAHKPTPKQDKAAEEKAKDPSSLTLEERVKRIEVILGIE